MKRLFISLYLDEDVDVLVAELIRARAFEATTTRELGHLHHDDDVQLAYAISQGQAMVTHNRADYEALAEQYFAAGRTHCGIIIAVRRSPYQIAQRLLTILNHVTADEMENHVRRI